MSLYGMREIEKRLEAEQRGELASLRAEVERLRAEVEQYKEMWAREFELRGDLAAMIERRMADASQDLRIRLRDAFDDLDARCNRQLRILAEDILDAVKQGGKDE